MESTSIRITLNFVDPNLDEQRRDEEVKNLLIQLKQLKRLGEIESVGRVADSNEHPDAKPLGVYLIGLLTAEVSVGNFKKLMGFLGDHLGNKPITLKVEANGRKLEVIASSQEELEEAIKLAKDFVKLPVG